MFVRDRHQVHVYGLSRTQWSFLQQNNNKMSTEKVKSDINIFAMLNLTH